jgi:hypothetical protein
MVTTFKKWSTQESSEIVTGEKKKKHLKGGRNKTKDRG